MYASLFNPDAQQNVRGLESPLPTRDFSRQRLDILEVGSGAGATTMPLLEKNCEAIVTCGDFCASANRLLRAR